jgi:hypothetical protein
MRYGLDGPGLIPGRVHKFFSSVQAGIEANPASYPLDTGGGGRFSWE